MLQLPPDILTTVASSDASASVVAAAFTADIPIAACRSITAVSATTAAAAQAPAALARVVGPMDIGIAMLISCAIATMLAVAMT
jgi:hypothetical protein